ncbi:hypothetical protein CONCODRAFT_79106, partial [Conidiobolus coronatus NRRL 28638]
KKLQKIEREIKNQEEIDNNNLHSTTTNSNKLETLAKNEIKVTLNNKPNIFLNYASKILQDTEYTSIKLIGESLAIPKVLQIANKLKTSNLKQTIKVENLSGADGKLCPRIVIELVKLNNE